VGRKVEVGITIKATDDATPVIEKLKTSAAELAARFEAMAARVGLSFNTTGSAAVDAAKTIETQTDAATDAATQLADKTDDAAKQVGDSYDGMGDAAKKAKEETDTALGGAGESEEKFSDKTKKTEEEVKKSFDEMADAAVKASNAYSKSLEEASSGGSAITSTIGNVATSVGGAFGFIGKAIVVFNQGMELAGKAANAFQTIIVETIAKSLEYRAINDKVSNQILEFGNSVNVLRARLGDALLPVLMGIIDVMEPMIDGWIQWLTTNNKIVAGGIIEFLRNTQVAVSAVALGLSLANKGWMAMEIVISTVMNPIHLLSAALNQFIASTAKGLGGIVKAVSGSNGVSESLLSVGAGMQRLANSSGNAFLGYSKSVTDSVNDMRRLDNMISEVEVTMLRGIGTVATAAQERLATATTGTNQTLEVQKERLEAIKEAARKAKEEMEKAAKEMEQQVAKFTAAVENGFKESIGHYSAYYSKLADLQEKDAKAWEATQQKKQDEAVETSKVIATSIGGAINQMIFSGQSLEKVMQGVFINIAQQAITAGITMVAAEIARATKTIAIASAEGKAKNMAAYASFPFVGVALGIAAGVALAAIINGFKLFSTGGVVRGGIAGRDSVPAMLTPGERVLTPSQNREYERGVRGGASVNVTINSLVPPDRANFDRMIRDHVAPSLARLRTARAI
jgi:hypothetical protein